jgi:hypothetical protein
MFKKNCKCKTKICKCGKRKIRGGLLSTSHDAQRNIEIAEEKLGIYKFDDNSNIYCFSDIEGNMPDELNKLMFKYDPKKEIYNPLPIKKNVFVFTGDLIDRGKYSIRNLQKMLKLKQYYPHDIILICGNRDLNKIRMYHECSIDYIEKNILDIKNVKERPQDINEIISKLKSMDKENIEFKNSMVVIASNINIKGIVNDFTTITEEGKEVKIKPSNDGKVDDVFKLSYADDLTRIPKMYSYTLGSVEQVKFFKEEFIEIFKLDKTIFDNNDELLYKLIAMMNMVMGKEWYNLPNELEQYNALYIKYLQKCHIIASFTIKDKLCIASHSGIPYYDDKKEGGVKHFYIPSEIGLEKPILEENNIENIKKINVNFNTFINGVLLNKYVDNYTHDQYKKYVAMSATCGNIDITETLKLTSEASPVVSSLVITKNDNGIITTVYDKRDISLKNLIVKDTDTKIKKIYNIYGHVPTGLLPTVRMNEDDNLTSYHIGLDISRAENGGGISNKLSFVYLKITDNDDTLTGKTITTLPYDKVIKVIKGKDQQNLQKDETIKTGINIEYKDLDINTYFDNKIIEEKYHTYVNPKEGEEKKPPKPIDGLLYLYTIDNKTFYGMHGYILVKYEVDEVGQTSKLITVSKSSKSPSSKSPLSSNVSKPQSPIVGGGKKNKTYTKSDKRFMNGKRQMVIYLGKRGCEYVKTAGEYVSLTKFIKAINKNKK